MKDIIRRVIAVLAVLFWMALIFGFSSQSGEESGGLSALIAEPIAMWIASWQKTEVTDVLYQQVDNAIRMTAHFSEYAMLGGLLLLAFYQFGLLLRWLPWLIGVVYAVLDEWHQAYSPGRYSDPVDVLIDACGLLCGILLTHYLMLSWRKKHVYHS